MSSSPRAQPSHKAHKSWDNVQGAALWGSCAKPSRRPSPPVLAALLVLALWVFWSFFLPIRVFGFLPLPTGYPRNNLRCVH